MCRQKNVFLHGMVEDMCKWYASIVEDPKKKISWCLWEETLCLFYILLVEHLLEYFSILKLQKKFLLLCKFVDKIPCFPWVKETNLMAITFWVGLLISQEA